MKLHWILFSFPVNFSMNGNVLLLNTFKCTIFKASIISLFFVVDVVSCDDPVFQNVLSFPFCHGRVLSR